MLALTAGFFSKSLAQDQRWPSGYPVVQSISTDDYAGSAQTWDITTDSRGVIYFGNSNYGIQYYNGQTWNVLTTPERTQAYAFARHQPTGGLFASTRYDIGYITRDSLMRPAFVSIADTAVTPKGKQAIGNQEIVFWGDKVVFLRENALYTVALERQQIKLPDSLSKIKPRKIYETEAEIYDITIVNDTLWLNDTATDGLSYTTDGITYINVDQPLRSEAKDLLHHNNKLQLVTTSGHWYEYHKGWWIKKSGRLNTEIYEAQFLKDGSLAISTLDDGFYILNSKGQIAYHLSKRHGMNAMITKNIYQDERGNVWVSSSNGLNKIEYRSPFRRLDIGMGIDDKIISAALGNGKLLLGGLRLWEWQQDSARSATGGKFHPISASIGQISELNTKKTWDFLLQPAPVCSITAGGI